MHATVVFTQAAAAQRAAAPPGRVLQFCLKALEFQLHARRPLQYRTSASVASVADRGPKLWYINKPMVTTYPRETGTGSGVLNQDCCCIVSCKHFLENRRTCPSDRHTEAKERKVRSGEAPAPSDAKMRKEHVPLTGQGHSCSKLHQNASLFVAAISQCAASRMQEGCFSNCSSVQVFADTRLACALWPTFSTSHCEDALLIGALSMEKEV